MSIDTDDTVTIDVFGPVKRGRGRPCSASPKTASQRMAKSRARRRQTGDGERRLDVWLSNPAFFAFERLVAHFPEMTKQAMLEKLILDYENTLMGQMVDEQFEAYFNCDRSQKTNS